MSLYKTIVLLGLLSLPAALAGCGFQPVYADKAYRNTAAGSNVSADLARVRLLPVSETVGNSDWQRPQTGRAGQKLQNLLIDRMYTTGYPKQPAYTLEIAVTSNENRLGIQKDSSATRAELLMTAQLVLRHAIGAELKTVKHVSGDELYRTTVRTRVSYSILEAQYGTLAARENAIDRGLEQIANDTVTRLSLYFSRAPLESPPNATPNTSPETPASNLKTDESR